MLVACIFSLTYILVPGYIIGGFAMLIFRPSLKSFVFILPIIISAVIPSIQMQWIIKSKIFGYMKDYFDYEEIFEFEDEKLFKLVDENKKINRSIILTGTPHGIISYGGLCAGAAAHPRYNPLVTAVAGAVLSTPILKHIVGIFGLIDASSNSLKKRLVKGGIEGSVVLYTG